MVRVEAEIKTLAGCCEPGMRWLLDTGRMDGQAAGAFPVIPQPAWPQYLFHREDFQLGHPRGTIVRWHFIYQVPAAVAEELLAAESIGAVIARRRAGKNHWPFWEMN